jgi:HPt (histidine-containing phosphotransfer) domain-containing protein
MGCANSLVTATEPPEPPLLAPSGSGVKPAECERRLTPVAHIVPPVPRKASDPSACVWTLEAVLRESEVPNKPTIDEHMVLDQVNGDIALLQDLNGMMYDQFKHDYGEIEQCHRTHNWFKLWKAAHSLKGATVNLGINKLSEICRLLEIMGKDMDKAVAEGQPISASQIQKAGVYIDLLAREWEEYRRCYEAFERRLLAHPP